MTDDVTNEEAAWNDLLVVLDLNLPSPQSNWGSSALFKLGRGRPAVDTKPLLVLLLRELQSHGETAAAAAVWSQKWQAIPAIAQLGMVIPQTSAIAAIAQRATILRELADMLGLRDQKNLSTKDLLNAMGTRLGLVRGTDSRWTTMVHPDDPTDELEM